MNGSALDRRWLAFLPGRSLVRPEARRGVLLGGLALLLMVAALLSVGVGAVGIEPSAALAILGAQLGLPLPWSWEPQQEAVMLAIRLPRVLLAILTGGALGFAGATIQGLFRNPLADPGLVGVSNGAALGAVTALVLGPAILPVGAAWLAPWLVPLFAFIGALATTLLIYRIAGNRDRNSVSTMLLAGIAFNALGGAGIGVLIFRASDAELRNITFWTLGGLGGATWPVLGTVLVPLLLAAALSIGLARPLNALLLGNDEARHLGVDVRSTELRVVLLAALAVGGVTAFSGVIGFVGLVVPHLLRLLSGPDHRTLIPGSALLGASLMLFADLAARTVVMPAELPVGIVTALIGAPFFLWLILHAREGRIWNSA